MLHYRAYLLDEHRHVISAANLYCADEQAAKERAQQLVGANDVELWQLDRRIAVFKSHPRPPQTIDGRHGRPNGFDAPRVAGRGVGAGGLQTLGRLLPAELERP